VQPVGIKYYICNVVARELYNAQYVPVCGFGGIGVSVLPLKPKFAGSNPAEGRKNPQHAFLRRGRKAACRRFAACKRSLELRGIRILGQICRKISRPRRVPPFATRGLSRRWTWRHLAEKVGKQCGGKQWQSTPKKLPMMKCARAIPVAWLGSGFC
jgi:hypothetical protein